MTYHLYFLLHADWLTHPWSRSRHHGNNVFFKDIEVLPLAKLIHCRIGLFMYKIFYKLQPTVINKMYGQNVDIHTYNTRQKYHLHVATGDSDFYTKSFYCSSILIWNDIMNKVDISVSLFKFKKLLKLYLLSNDLRLGYISQ